MRWGNERVEKVLLPGRGLGWEWLWCVLWEISWYFVDLFLEWLEWLGKVLVFLGLSLASRDGNVN